MKRQQLLNIAIITTSFLLLLVAGVVLAQDTGIDIAPVDISSIIEKLGGWAVVAILLSKLIFNDMAHLKTIMSEMNSNLKLLLRLQTKSMNLDPDIIEAKEATESPPVSNITGL